MATNTSAASKKSTAGKSSKSRKKTPPKDPKQPVRRAVIGAVCLLLAVFTFLGYFSSEGVFIEWFCGIVRGLVGKGFIFVPPMLLVAALILFFHHGRPVIWRLCCALFVPSAAGSLYQLFGGSDYELSFKIFGALWEDGRQSIGGGAFAGTVSAVFEKLFSKTGSAIIFIFLLLFMLAVIVWRPLMRMRRRYQDRPRYEPEPEPEYVPKPKKEPKPAEASSAQEVQAKPRAIDIPVDEPISPRPAKSKHSLFNKTPAVKTPVEVLTGKPPEAEAAVSEPEIKKSTAVLQPEIISSAPAPATAPASVTAPVIAPTATPVPAAAPTSVSAAAQPIPAAAAPAREAGKREEDVFTPPPEGTHISYYKFPPLTLLAADTSSGNVDTTQETTANRERLEGTLSSFGINSLVSSITRGPTVTRFEIELEAGVKLSRLTGLADDIALSLGASGVRIAAIPNKISTVGIEVPNKTISRVYLRDIIDTPTFRDAESKLTFAIGKNISGDAICGNISKLPHMLVAGTTGSGKSVCLNSLILSILYKATPEDVKFIMIDPKMVEFKVYNGIPHLLVPVVTEAKKAAGALQWAVTEMMKRYRVFSDSGARDIASYNELCAESDDAELKTMSHIVVVIDELADLMLVASKEVEESVCRVAQMGRAAGVHLIIATQSPRADVITGLMKANIPSRIALKVSSSLESRIILDAGGAADKLVGNGDMLYAPIGTSKPIRIQGTWVSDAERENIVKFVKKSGEAEYAEDVMAQIERAAEGKQSGKQEPQHDEPKSDFDELLPQAADVIFETNQASVSMLQRRLKLGYSRAARLVDQLEEIGLVGPFEGSKPRQILITKQQWQEMQFITGTAPAAAPTTPEPVKPAFAPEQTLFSADDLFEDGNK